MRSHGNTEKLQRPSGRRLKVLDPRVAQTLLDAVGQLPSRVNMEKEVRDEDPPTSMRNRLMLECALQAGLRQAEVVALSLASLPKHKRTSDASRAAKCTVKLSNSYKRERLVSFPVWLVKALHLYIKTERADAVKAGKRRSERYKEPQAIFLNEARAKVAPGGAISVQSFIHAFRKAQIAAGFGSEAEVADVDIRKRKWVATVPFTIHDLRSMYAAEALGRGSRRARV